jgi:hypothetical protein
VRLVITEQEWMDKTREWVAEKILEYLAVKKGKQVTHVRERLIFRTILYARDLDQRSDGINGRLWSDQNRGFFVMPRNARTSMIKLALRQLEACGKLIVVDRFPMRDTRLMGMGDEERVYALGGVLDELAAVLNRSGISE